MPSPKKKKYEEISLFFETFIGEYVELMTTRTIETVIDTEEGAAVATIPLTVKGYLLDKDDIYYYIGDGPGQVESGVRITSVDAITIVKQKTRLDEILDEMDEPGELN